MDINYQLTKKQKAFIDATEDEVLYGGAAGGGKSYGQIIDAFLKALQYPGIKQIIFRNSFPELNRSIILTALSIIPKELYRYINQSHKMTFTNGSSIEFGYIASDTDVSNYQSAEYDIIRFDELTHFTEYQYKYMRSRIRGVNNFPKQLKSSTNPGSRGHAWVKEMFIKPEIPGKSFVADDGTSFLFIPALVTENKFLMKSDKGYIKRLESLPEAERKALLYGDWEIFEGQFFPEFKNVAENYEDRIGTHVIKPFKIPDQWTIYRSFDFGYARPFSVGWWAVDYDGR
ncbi:MAG: phage terminase large subunit, partial [Clostridia bacterium]|nr:phage terminase large subunit [Clostridia bacterium]